MRPIRLEIEGLRSFRAPQVIDFTGRDYVAIIGDTGAGKSSILEAMTFALFGRTTFSGQGLQELMNASSTSLRVVFAFDVGGDQWIAARTLRRAGTGTVSAGPVSLKHVGPDDACLAAFEGARQVTAHVERVLGLDADAFLRTVVLPQGQFSRLLVDDDQRQRSSVLRQIWRTDELTEAGNLADAALRELLPLQARVAQALSAEPPDPEAHLSTLEAELAQRIATRDATQARQQSASAAAVALAAADRQVERCDLVIVELSKWDGRTAAVTADALVAAGARADAERASVEASLDELAQRMEAVPSDDDGYDAADISRFSVLLQQLPGLVSQRALAGGSLATARVALEQLRLQAETSALSAEAATADLSARLADRASLAARTETTVARRTRAQSAIDAARRAHGGLIEAEATVRQAEAAIAAHGVALGDARSALDRAQQTADAAAAAFSAAQRANAAATAAHGLHVGEACPVCNRELDPGWARPVAPGLDAAEESARDAAGALGLAQQATVRLEARVHAAEEAAASARHAHAAAAAAARGALTELMHELGSRDLGGSDAELLRAIDLGRSDAELLRAVDEAVQHARDSLAAQEELVEQARSHDAACGAARAAAEAAHQAKVAELASLAARWEDATTAVADHLAGLPDAVRPAGFDMPVSSSTPLPSPAPAAVSQAVEAVLASLASRQSVLTERQAAREDLAREIADVRARQRALDQSRIAEINEPAGALWTAVVSRTGALERAATDLDHPISLAATTRQPPLGELAAHVDLISNATDALVAAAHDLASTARASAEAAEELLAALAAGAGGGLHAGGELVAVDHERTVALIAAEADDAAFEARAAQAAADAFCARMPAVVSLQQAAADLDARILALTDLAAALRDGAFPKWLTLRRSRSLLVHASRLLAEITAGRFAFAELDDADSQWFVFDSDHGQPRSPASLSGGEKFVASLSLALGMVEMMGRQGGRIGSLFLDEGFGALDRTNLDAAVDALASVAATGRMVAVITHLNAVAEQIDDILAVTCGATGTKVAWLDAAERAAISDRSVVGSDRASAGLEGPEGRDLGAGVRSGLLE